MSCKGFRQFSALLPPLEGLALDVRGATDKNVIFQF